MLFRFKKFAIEHHPDVFKFGTDAALLATWVKLLPAAQVLEVGTGSGVISLMLAQRFPDIYITGIDISDKSILLARRNLSKFPFNTQIRFVHSSIQEFNSLTKFDNIVSNPPFFDSSTKSPSITKNTARHTISLSLYDLLSHSKKLLKPRGKISLIYPVRYLCKMKETCQLLQIFPHQITYVRGTKNKPIKRVLVSIGKYKDHLIENELVINGQHQGYSLATYQMLEPFLLKLGNNAEQ